MFPNPIVSFLLGSFFATLALSFFNRYKIGSYDKFFKERLEKNEKEIEEKNHQLELKLQKKEFEHQKKCDEKSYAQQKKLEEEKTLLKKREEKLLIQTQKNERFSKELDQKVDVLSKQSQELLIQKEHVLKEKEKLIKALEEISKLTQKEAEEKLFEKLSLQVKKNCAVWGARFFKEKKASVESDAKKLLADAINRLALPSTSQISIHTVHLPNEEMKSRIIGREGRNIHYLENILGVNLLLDETPKTVIISAIDPFRKAVAKETLEKLILDGRIHPTKIDEEYQNAKLEVEKRTLKKAEDYALKLGLCDLHPKMLRLLAKMELMNSLGQNLLDHSYQVALIMGVIASELQLDAPLSKRIGFLHDIGKAAFAEMEGSHALIGQKLAKKYGESDEVANGIGCHHDEITPTTLEGSLCSAADTISAARPGSRSESLQHYVKRIKKLEEIATSFEAVEKAFALQAGREIRVITYPDKIDDASLSLLAKELADKIALNMNHPGKIKISVMRQKQVIEFASSLSL